MSAAELIIATGSAPTAPASGRVTLYVGTNNHLYIKDATDTIVQVATIPSTPPTVSGATGGNAALQSLLTALAGFGLIVDNSS